VQIRAARGGRRGTRAVDAGVDRAIAVTVVVGAVVYGLFITLSNGFMAAAGSATNGPSAAVQAARTVERRRERRVLSPQAS
jgi:hypothetical protein